MAAVNNNSPSGFSYAQAARGRSSAATSQTTSSKVTSGTATPATGAFSDLTPSSNWADDVEASEGAKSVESQKDQQEEVKSLPVKEDATEHAVPEAKTPNGASAVSSPDLPASSSTTTKEDDSSSAPTGSSSETTWDTKSQTSEPAWIAERKERQSGSQSSDTTVKGDSVVKDVPSAATSKSLTLQEAPPPPVNFWQKRAQEAKAKMAVSKPAPAPASASAPAPAPPAIETAALKENQRPRTDSRRKANSIAGLPRELPASSNDDPRKTGSFQGKRIVESRNNSSRQNSKPVADGVHPDSQLDNNARALPSERQSLPNLTMAPPPSVKDEVSWPTPDTAQDKERKGSQEKDGEEKTDDDATPPTKRKKQEWKTMPVVPNVIWETPSMNERQKRNTPNSERGGRGGNGARGRGGNRGTPNGTNGNDRALAKSTTLSEGPNVGSSAIPEASPLKAGQETALPPSKAARASSASPQRQSSDATHLNHSSISHIVPSKNAPASADGGLNAPNGSAGTPSFEAHRNRSPTKTDTTTSEQKDDDLVPKPIPRRNSIGTQTEESKGGAGSNARDGPPVRRVPSDSRKEARYDSFRDSTWNGAPRGSKRGGRGRGGNGARELANGHSGTHTYGNSYVPEFSAASPYAIPQSPSMYTAPRGHHQFTYPSPSRGGWRGNPRAQSIPVDSYYDQRLGGSFAGARPPAPIQTAYVPGMYEMNGYPYSALPYSPQMETYLMDMVITQLDYYFSIDNLLKDLFLRKHMDSQGFVFLDVIANFNRVKQLTQDKEVLKYACTQSQIIDIRVGEDGKERLRKREGWDQFVLPMEQREPGAQSDGPERLELVERPQLSMNIAPSQLRGPASAGLPQTHQRLDRRSYDSAYPAVNGMAAPFVAYNGFPEPAFGEMMNGDEMRGRAAKSPINETSISPTKTPLLATNDGSEAEPDAFVDEQISALTVVVKVNANRPTPHNAVSRTFSNGSIDSRSILSEIERPFETRSMSTMSGETLVNGSDSSSNLSRVASPSNARSSERPSPNADLAVFWVKEQDKDIPVQQLPSDLTSEPYAHLRLKALEQRSHAATGNCPYDMDVLYQFWCHFLIRNFNNRMYTEFKDHANEDGKSRHNFTGLQNLIKFYSQSLASHNPIRDRVVKDYVQLVQNEPQELKRAAFKDLRAAWRNGALNLKNRKKLADILDDELKEKLDKTDT